MAVTAIILAGGKSKRFQRDKTLLKLMDNKLIIETIVEKCRPLFPRILIISNQENKFNIPGTTELTDFYKHIGPIGGIHAGLSAMDENTAFVTACDMPFFEPTLAKQLLELSDGFDAVVPRNNVYIEPLFAIYKKTALPVIEAAIAQEMYSMINIIETVNTCFLDQAQWAMNSASNTKTNIFYNINYPNDYQICRSLKNNPYS